MSEITSTADRVADPGIRVLFQQDARWQAWLDVESALAQAQARLGMIPAEAARAIAATARMELLDRERIDQATRRTSHTIVPLVWELARAAGHDAGGYVHWGATTQNIVQTGDLLNLRRVHRTVQQLVRDILLALGDLAERSAEMPIAARTHGQHAVPTTFGYKVAVWVDEFIRHAQRLRDVEQRTFVTLLGGAAGTYASMGKRGPAVQEAVAEILAMPPMPVPARSIGDHIAEYLTVLGLIGSTCGKLGREVYTLMKTEFGEVEEPLPAGTVGSSTMPQKRNPHLCQDIIARAASVRGAVPLALEAMQMEHESDRALHLIMQEATETICVALGDSLVRVHHVVADLRLFPERMRRNLDLTDGLIMAEAVMMRLGETLGRQSAHDVVYAAAQIAAADGRRFVDVLAEDPRVSDHIDRSALDAIIDPTSYLGESARIAKDAVARAREAAIWASPIAKP